MDRAPGTGWTQRLAIARVNVAREASKAWRKLRAPRGMRELPPRYPQDLSKFSRRLVDRVRPFTMTSIERIVNLELAVRYIVANGIPGAFVECGVGAGGSMMAVAWTLLELGVDDRELYLFDTYEGTPRPTAEDVSVLGKPALRKYERRRRNGVSTWHNYPLEGVREAMARTGYPASRLHFVKGLVQQTLPAAGLGELALIRLDTNLYESTRVEMHELYPRLVPGGVIIVDDYNRWLGQRKAVDEYLAARGEPVLLTRIDDHAVQGVKPGASGGSDG